MKLPTAPKSAPSSHVRLSVGLLLPPAVPSAVHGERILAPELPLAAVAFLVAVVKVPLEQTRRGELQSCRTALERELASQDSGSGFVAECCFPTLRFPTVM